MKLSKKAQTQLEKETTCLNQMLVRIDDVDQSIRQFSEIDPSCIAPIRATPKTGTGQFGDLRRTLIDILKQKNGPITTVEIIRRMAPVLGWDLTSARGRKSAREAVRKPLQIFKRWKVVERLPSCETDQRRSCGVWQWIDQNGTEDT